MKPTVCVVICYWIGRSPKPLLRLLAQMQKYPAGETYDVLIVCNGGDEKPLAVPTGFPDLRIEVINRKNEGWNLGAWQAGWKERPDYDYYLFLQAECFIKEQDWLRRYVHRFQTDDGIGLLGEHLMWNAMTWDYVRKCTELDLGAGSGIANTIDEYRANLLKAGIDPGDSGTHLVSIILFTSRKVLEQVNGFPLMGETYIQAVSCEIGFSKQIQNKGYRVAQLTDTAFWKIGHRQWTRSDRIKVKAINALKSSIRKLLPRRGG